MKDGGGEDDDLYERLKANSLLGPGDTIVRPPKESGIYRALCQDVRHHPKGVRGRVEYQASLQRLDSMRKGSDRYKDDGLSSVSYQLTHEKSLSMLYTHFWVSS